MCAIDAPEFVSADPAETCGWLARSPSVLGLIQRMRVAFVGSVSLRLCLHPDGWLLVECQDRDVNSWLTMTGRQHPSGSWNSAQTRR